MVKREYLKERWGTFCIMTLLFAFMVVGLASFPGVSAAVYGAGTLEGAYDPDTYQGTTYTVHGNYGSYTTGEVEKVFNNLFYYKDTIVVEDTDITANQEGKACNFNLISYDTSETVSQGFATLKTLEDKGIVRVTTGTVLDDTLGDARKGQTTIRKIEFINPNVIVNLVSSKSNSVHPGFSGGVTKNGIYYTGIVGCIDYAGVYATSCDVVYSYKESESDYLWQDGEKSQLPEKLYVPIPGGSYQCTIPLPAQSGKYISISLSEIGDTHGFSYVAVASVELASSLESLKKGKITVTFRPGSGSDYSEGSPYSEGNIQILDSKMQVEFQYSNGRTVNFHQNGGIIPGIAEQSDYYVARVLNSTYTAGEIAEFVSVPSRDGYKFAGWGFKNPDSYYFMELADVTEVFEDYFQASSYTFTITAPAAFDMYALWTTDQQTYTVTFHANGHGTAPKAQTVEKGKTATKPANPTAAGYTFGGWYREAACKNAYDFHTAVTSDLTLYAKWTAIEEPITPTPSPEIQEPITIQQAPKVLTATAKKNKVTVTWKAIKTNSAGKKLLNKIKSIQIQVAANKKFTKNVQSKSLGVSKTKAVLKLSRKTTYYVRVRYLGKDGGVSKWSNVKKVKTN